MKMATYVSGMFRYVFIFTALLPTISVVSVESQCIVCVWIVTFELSDL